MAEIGSTLREARMRAGIDIGEVEARTKIRAKYLRALENEEWDLLPGSTFVKSFLRTYAETLGLDAKLLVEEYKFRHDPYESTGIQRRAVRGKRGSSGAFGPPKRTNWLPIVGLLVLVAIVLFAVGKLSSNEDESPPAATTTTASTPSPEQQAAQEQEQRDKAAALDRTVVKLRIKAPADREVKVCVRDARDRVVVRDVEIRAGRQTSLLRSQRFRVVLDDSGARVTDRGKRLRLRAGSDGVVAYEITHEGARVLPRDQRPSCS